MCFCWYPPLGTCCSCQLHLVLVTAQLGEAWQIMPPCIFFTAELFWPPPISVQMVAITEFLVLPPAPVHSLVHTRYLSGVAPEPVRRQYFLPVTNDPGKGEASVPLL